jgi:hypothetical protein
MDFDSNLIYLFILPAIAIVGIILSVLAKHNDWD